MNETKTNQPDPVTLGLGILAFVPFLGFLFGVTALANGWERIKSCRAAGVPMGTMTAVGMTLAGVGILVWAMILIWQALPSDDESYVPPRCAVNEYGRVVC